MTAKGVVAIEVNSDSVAWIYNVGAEGVLGGGVAGLVAEIAADLQVRGEFWCFEVVF